MKTRSSVDLIPPLANSPSLHLQMVGRAKREPFTLVYAGSINKPRKAKRVPLPSHPPRDSVPPPSTPMGPPWGKRDPLLAKHLGHVVRDATPWHLREPIRVRSGALGIVVIALLVLGGIAWGSAQTGGTNGTSRTDVHNVQLP